MEPKVLFEKHAIPEEDRQELGRFIATGNASDAFHARLNQNPNYQACAAEGLRECFQPFADALACEQQQ